MNLLDGVPVPERAKAATRQMIIYNFKIILQKSKTFIFKIYGKYDELI